MLSVKRGQDEEDDDEAAVQVPAKRRCSDASQAPNASLSGTDNSATAESTTGKFRPSLMAFIKYRE